MIRIHIGHHFYGAGNFGDDLMLAGFLESIKSSLKNLHFSCCTPHDTSPLARRFPEIEWLPYGEEIRKTAINRSDVWLGLGDTPFQTDVGLWFLNHLREELHFCKSFHKPMFFLGVGVNDRNALRTENSRTILEYASRIWTRDRQSASMINEIVPSAKVTESADLANVCLSSFKNLPIEKNSMGYVLNFEQPEQFDVHTFHRLIHQTPPQRQYWIVQEVRRHQGMENDLYSKLDFGDQSQMEIRSSEYFLNSLHEYLTTFGSPEYLLTSRYHAAIVGAWKGCKVVAITRNEKIRGLVSQTGLTSIDSMNDFGKIEDALRRSHSIPREKMAALADSARKSCSDFLDEVA